MQDRPVCFYCDEPVTTNADMIFEAPCGHDKCSSAVFHPLCLMEFRERRDRYVEWLQDVRKRWIEEHGGRVEIDPED